VQAGFSLLEFMVAIAVILMLLSLLAPSLARLKELARRVVCGSRMQQQLTAVAHYASDNDRKLLPGYRYASNPASVRDDDTWCLNADTYESYRDTYLGGNDRMFVCPNVARLTYEDWRGQPFTFPTWWGGAGGPTYLLGFNYNGNKPGLNAELAEQGYRYAYPDRLFSAESETVPLFSDFNRWTPTFRRGVVAHTAYGGLRVEPSTLDAISAGTEGGNYAYAAGHVIWRDVETLTPVRTFSRGGAIVWDLLPEEVQ